MKVLIHYEDNPDTELWKSLKITLPKSWKTGPTSKLLGQFVESYNANESLGGGPNPMKEEEMHLAIKVQEQEKSVLRPLASDAVTIDVIADRADVYVLHGPSETLAEVEARKKAAERAKREELINTVQCTHFGCKKRFPRGGPYPDCCYHKSPPVFHETAKFWSCCPDKKAYDFDDFEKIPGCCNGTCTEVKEDDQKLFLGGSDLREQVEAVQLKSIDDFNMAQAAGGADAAPVLERLQKVLEELGIEKELYQQVVEGIRKDQSTHAAATEAELLDAIKVELGNKLKNSLKAIAAEQLRIK